MLRIRVLLAPLLLATTWFAGASAAAEPLPGTAPLDWPEADLSTRLMDGAHRFVERQIRESEAKRARFWKRDFSSREAYEKSVETNRQRLREILGVVDERLPPDLERYGSDTAQALVAETDGYQVWQVRWSVLPGIWGVGLQALPRTTPKAHVVVIPDAGQSPEQLLGLAPGVSAGSQLARRLVEQGVEVVVPVTVSREKLKSDDPRLKASDQTHREWLYRQAFHLGRQVVGYEIQIVSAAVDGFYARRAAGARVGVCGFAEGGRTAFYAAAVDPRIDVALVSGYFDSRQQVWAEPIDRNVWGLLREFGDAEIAGLIAPRGLVIEHAPVPEVTGQKGEWRAPKWESVQAEVARIGTTPLAPNTHDANSLDVRPELFASPQGACSGESSARFARRLGLDSFAEVFADVPVERRATVRTAARHERLVRELEQHVQGLLQASEHVRDREFPLAVLPELKESKWSTEPRQPTLPPERFIAGAKQFRERFQDEAMGRFDERLAKPNPRTRLVAETERWRAYDVVLDVYPELVAWGVLVLPNDLKPGERRPVVVVQHGRNGVPRDMLDANSTAYGNIAAKLAERGFIAFAPHNLYRGEDRYRWLSRKANTVKASLFSFIVASHDQILRWLEQQPFVDGRRMAFYGLSYGGETAVRVPPILEKYSLSICSGDFNQWTRKVAATDQPFSFMRTIEWEMPYWNLGHTFDYAEMAYLMIPRPFMVERGHNDLVGRDAWVAHEYAKVRWLYAQLGLSDRTEIEFFQGAHSMRAEGTIEFLHRHLAWPKPAPGK